MPVHHIGSGLDHEVGVASASNLADFDLFEVVVGKMYILESPAVLCVDNLIEDPPTLVYHGEHRAGLCVGSKET